MVSTRDRRWLKTALFSILGAGVALAQASTDPFGDIDSAQPAQAETQSTGTQPPSSFFQKFFDENFAFKKEILSQFDTTMSDGNLGGSNASRQSLGFEVAKKFSDSTSTIASFDFQGRLVRRDGYNPVPNDMEGAGNGGWAAEYHNFYLDFYNVFNPLMSQEARKHSVGRFNFRVGRFYVPFGLNLQTDTHGTLLQLSNGDNFGFERDWYTGFWGSMNKYLNYDAYYMAGSGYHLTFKGQSGLGALRISLSNKYSSEHGLEGGLSIIGGERLAAPMGDMNGPLSPLRTQRGGADVRYRHTAPGGLVTLTTELSGGRDGNTALTTQLGQAEYLRASRRWGIATQYRRDPHAASGIESAIIGEFTWYFRNDVANTNAHWIKLNVERQLQGMPGPPRTIVALQYYFYL